MMMRRTVEQMEKLQEVAEKQELLMGALSHDDVTTRIVAVSTRLADQYPAIAAYLEEARESIASHYQAKTNNLQGELRECTKGEY